MTEEASSTFCEGGEHGASNQMIVGSALQSRHASDANSVAVPGSARTGKLVVTFCYFEERNNRTKEITGVKSLIRETLTNLYDTLCLYILRVHRLYKVINYKRDISRKGRKFCTYINPDKPL